MNPALRQLNTPEKLRLTKFLTAFLWLGFVVSLFLSRSNALAAESCSKVFAPESAHEKAVRLMSYLERLSDKTNQDPSIQNKLRENIYDEFVISTDQFPPNFTALELRIFRENGFGHVHLTSVDINKRKNYVIQDQKTSLDYWIKHLTSSQAATYPPWLKYWILHGLKDLSRFDHGTGKFAYRSKSTVAPFPELNVEALHQVVALVKAQDPVFFKSLRSMNFGHMYEKALADLGIFKNGSFATNEGKWVRFAHKSHAKFLVAALSGRNTGWCTVGESKAQEYLMAGDFYVYFSLDMQGEATIPRVGIHVKDGQIVEIRGVAEGQKRDPQIISSGIIEKKLSEFQGMGDTFTKKDHDMKLMTSVAKKVDEAQELSDEELLFLYEVETRIEGFAKDRDPRIRETIAKRDTKKDLNRLYDIQIKNQLK